MKNRPVRRLAVAALLATVAGTGVMAGVDGPMTVWVASWLAGTVLAAGAAAMLNGSPHDQKKLIDGSPGEQVHLVLQKTPATENSRWTRGVAAHSGVRTST